VLKERLSGRGTDSDEKLQERFVKAEKELQYADKFDVILKNYDLETACKEAEQLVADFINK
jgi:guanylate kinase